MGRKELNREHGALHSVLPLVLEQKVPGVGARLVWASAKHTLEGLSLRALWRACADVPHAEGDTTGGGDLDTVIEAVHVDAVGGGALEAYMGEDFVGESGG